MDHQIYLSVDGAPAAELAADLAAVPGLAVAPREESGQLAMDPLTISLVVAGVGTVNALISALASVWVAKIANSRPAEPTAAEPARPVIHLHTDLDSVRITLSRDGDVVEVSGSLPERVDDVTEVRLAAEPA